MGSGDDGGERVVVLPAVAHGERVFPRAGVRIERVVEVVVAHVGFSVGPLGRAQQRDADGVAGGVVPILGVVKDAEAMHAVAARRAGKIGPAHGGDFELGLFPRVIACGWPVDGAVGNLVGGKRPVSCDGEGCLEQDVGLVPVDVVLDVDLVALKADGLDEFGVLPVAGYTDCVANLFDGVGLVDGGWLSVKRAGIDIPGVIFLGRVLEELELPSTERLSCAV